MSGEDIAPNKHGGLKFFNTEAEYAGILHYLQILGIEPNSYAGRRLLLYTGSLIKAGKRKNHSFIQAFPVALSGNNPEARVDLNALPAPSVPWKRAGKNPDPKEFIVSNLEPGTVARFQIQYGTITLVDVPAIHFYIEYNGENYSAFTQYPREGQVREDKIGDNFTSWETTISMVFKGPPVRRTGLVKYIPNPAELKTMGY